MKARTVLFDELGGPEVLYLSDVEIGEPGPGQVRVRIDAFGLNRGEVFLRTGRYYYDAVLPGSRLGTEAAGVVEAVGRDVTGYATGDAVSIVAKPNDEGMSVHGVQAERVVVAAERLIRRPEHMDAVTGAAIWVPAFTSYGALVEVGGLRPGDDVVVTAASSSVGLAAVQIAAHLGARPIAVTRTGAKTDRLLAAGAAHVIAADDGDVARQVHALTGERGARLILDGVAGPGLPDLARAVAPDGMLIVYGSLDGRPTPLPMWWPINVYGYAVFHLFADEERVRRAETFITDGLRAGALAPVIDRTFDLADIAEAHRYMESNAQVGKIVVTVQH
ncbi:zinc-dependent alcohol dehydrogenase family protein [Nonomuraea rhodomycinica]|uniref:Zinc-dependent alcohol dehydrogenase family protein n=1 Tax=Nonomuraea rhodomycinica TaxID=1712872 RepID=A0A7Y6MGA8_9ACTN|nr:zinc-dependent alcohol dehydrogenase family protein [Nonomuraea rhodomycinica]NUW45875.1 zinc-dependent alcohol dehydrogenase family protein [Nonomuraea rhodomycinica]